MSDFGPVPVARPPGAPKAPGVGYAASLDHAVWFHRPFVPDAVAPLRGAVAEQQRRPRPGRSDRCTTVPARWWRAPARRRCGGSSGTRAAAPTVACVRAPPLTCQSGRVSTPYNPLPPTAPSCYRHPDRETYVSCTRCQRCICPDCMRVGRRRPPVRRLRRRGRRSVRAAEDRIRRQAGQPPVVTYVLIAINVVMFVLQRPRPRTWSGSWCCGRPPSRVRRAATGC